MSDGNWRSNRAAHIGLALLIAWSAMALHRDLERRRDHPTAAPIERVVAAPPAISAPPPNAEPDRDEWREERDLQAQQEIARWTFWILILSGVGTLITGVGVWLVYRTLRESVTATRAAVAAAIATQESVEIAERQLVEQRSPLLLIHAAPALMGAPEAWSPAVDVIIENQSDVPAIIQSAALNFDVLGHLPRPGLDTSANHFSETLRALHQLRGRASSTVAYRRRAAWSGDEITRATGDDGRAYFWGVITYSDALGTEWERGLCMLYEPPTGAFGALWLQAQPGDLLTNPDTALGAPRFVLVPGRDLNFVRRKEESA